MNSFSPLSKFILIYCSLTWKSLSLISSCMDYILKIISLFLSPNFSLSAIAAFVLSSAILTASLRSDTCLWASLSFSCSYWSKSYNLSISSVFSWNCSRETIVDWDAASSSSYFLPISVNRLSGNCERSPSFRRLSSTSIGSICAGNFSLIYASNSSLTF